MKQRLTIVLVIIYATTHFSCNALTIPEWAKTAASVGYTTLSKGSDETKKELLAGSCPSSTQRLWGTCAAALAATWATNRLLATRPTYHLLDRATRRITSRYTRLPLWARCRVMPALSMAASSMVYAACFHALQEPACSIEEHVIKTAPDSPLLPDYAHLLPIIID